MALNIRLNRLYRKQGDLNCCYVEDQTTISWNVFPQQQDISHGQAGEGGEDIWQRNISEILWEKQWMFKTSERSSEDLTVLPDLRDNSFTRLYAFDLLSPISIFPICLYIHSNLPGSLYKRCSNWWKPTSSIVLKLLIPYSIISAKAALLTIALPTWLHLTLRPSRQGSSLFRNRSEWTSNLIGRVLTTAPQIQGRQWWAEHARPAKY